MGWRGPEYPGEFPSLGWQLLDWFTAYLPSPADPARPLELTEEQATIIVRWYAIDPTSGEWIYDRACLRMAKGWGKSPLLGADAIAQLAGPVLFDGWDAAGEPVGRPWGTLGAPPAWVQIAAVSVDQTDNTYDPAYQMLVANEHRAAIELGIDDGRTRLYLTGGRRGRLEPVTASAGSREGQPITAGYLDETHLWYPHNGGPQLAGVLRRNLAKMGGRSVESTNSFIPGRASVAEATHRAATAPGGNGILYVARESRDVSPDDPDDKLLAELRYVYGDAWWVRPQALLKTIRKPDTKWEDSVRFFFNRNHKGDGRAVDLARWDRLARPHDVAAGTRIGLGFDGSISRDATVLVGCTADGYEFVIGAWVRPEGAADWRVPRDEVHAAVAGAFSTWSVGRMYCDPPKWFTEVDEWAARWGDKVVLELWTNQDARMGPATDRWLTDYREATQLLEVADKAAAPAPERLPMTHDGSDVLRAHVGATALRTARARADEDDGRTLYVPLKPDDGSLIDGFVAAVLARAAAATMPPEEPPPAPLQPFVAFT